MVSAWAPESGSTCPPSHVTALPPRATNYSPLGTSLPCPRVALQSLRTLGSSAACAGQVRQASRDVYIGSAARTPIGSFRAALADVPATELGSIAVRAAIDRAGIAPADVEDGIIGNVISAGLGQAPARQVMVGAGTRHPLSRLVFFACPYNFSPVCLGAVRLHPILGSVALFVGAVSESAHSGPLCPVGVISGTASAPLHARTTLHRLPL